jgi:hypothetical protein
VWAAAVASSGSSTEARLSFCGGLRRKKEFGEAVVVAIDDDKLGGNDDLVGER